MKKPLKKSVKALLIALSVIAFIGICFISVTVYVKHEMSKPVFEFPEIIEEKAVCELPESKEAAFELIKTAYGNALNADNVEVSFKTDVGFDGEITSPFSDADNAVLSRAYSQAADNFSELYAKCENVIITEAQNVPEIYFTKEDITDFTAEYGKTNDYGELEDEELYYITLSIKPEAVDADSDSEIYKKILETASVFGKVTGCEVKVKEAAADFTVNRYSGNIMSAKFRQKMLIKASAETDNAAMEIPYETVTKLDFLHYGIHFTDRQIVVKPKDMKALPLEVWINGDATGDEYELNFNVSKDGMVKIDKDGVMTVLAASEEPFKITAELIYGGETYTDELVMYSTEKEVKTDERDAGY